MSKLLFIEKDNILWFKDIKKNVSCKDMYEDVQYINCLLFSNTIYVLF